MQPIITRAIMLNTVNTFSNMPAKGLENVQKRLETSVPYYGGPWS